MTSLTQHAINLTKVTTLATVFAILCSCAATQVALEHKDLKVKTELSETVFIDDVPSREKTIYVSIKNTSDKPINISNRVKEALSAQGYKVVSNPNYAHFKLQANIRKVAEMSQSASKQALGGGFGSALMGAGTGAALGSLANNGNVALAGGVIGGAVGMAADALVKDVNYAMITDIQVSERTQGAIYQKTKSNLKQGTSAQTVQQYSEKTNYKRYRTRVVSNADKVNLKFAEAQPALEAGLVKAISGIF